MFFHREGRLATHPAQASLERMQAPLESPPIPTAAKRLSVANSFNMALRLTETALWTANFCTKDCEYLLDLKAEFPPGYDRGEDEA